MTSLEEHGRGRIVTSKGPIIRGIIIGYCILALGLLGAIARAEHEARNDGKERLALGLSIAKKADAGIRKQALADCKEIERLKFRVRYTAMKNYRELRANARLLGIPLTRALQEKALTERNATLRRYASSPCPRPVKTQ